MNSHNKIYDLEATPPAGAWNNIAKDLDEWQLHQRLSKKLSNTEILPPSNLWSKIATHLNETEQEQHLSRKLYHLQTEVPLIIWNNITCELDNAKASAIIQKKLANTQVQPPAMVWHNIQEALNSSRKLEQKSTVPMHYGWLKYVAAACFITVVGISALFIFNDGGGNNQMVNSSATTTASVPASTTQNTQTNGQGAQLQQPQPTFNDTQQKVFASIKTHMGNAYTVSSEKNTALKNRYIILMTQDGNVVRMSKKVSNWADCIAGEDHSCDDQISKWQKEMASSAAAASPDNFLDILDMVTENTPAKLDM